MSGSNVTRRCVRCHAEADAIVAGTYFCARHAPEVPIPPHELSFLSAAVPNPPPLPVPVGRQITREPELVGLIKDWEDGRLQPINVELGRLPRAGTRVECPDGVVVVTAAMHRVAEDMRLLMGLRSAVDEDRPLPYSTTLCAKRCGLRDAKQASRVLRKLVRTGVVVDAGSLQPRGKPDGTKLYAPPELSPTREAGVPHAPQELTVDVESRSGSVGEPSEPAHQSIDSALVAGTESAVVNRAPDTLGNRTGEVTNHGGSVVLPSGGTEPA